MKGVFTRIRDRLARKRARPDTQGSSTDAVEPIGVTEPTAVTEPSEIGASDPVANPRPTNASIVFVEALPVDRPARTDRAADLAEVLPDRQLTVLDVVMYTLHTVMHSDSALKNFRNLVVSLALLFCGTTGFAAALYLFFHHFAPESAPSFPVLAASVFGLGSLSILVGTVWMRIHGRATAMRPWHRPLQHPYSGDRTRPSDTGRRPSPRLGNRRTAAVVPRSSSRPATLATITCGRGPHPWAQRGSHREGEEDAHQRAGSSGHQEVGAQQRGQRQQRSRNRSVRVAVGSLWPCGIPHVVPRRLCVTLVVIRTPRHCWAQSNHRHPPPLCSLCPCGRKPPITAVLPGFWHITPRENPSRPRPPRR